MTKKDDIQKALENVSEAASLLAIHGAGGYSIESSALDAVFVRTLVELRDALRNDDRTDWYDPYADVHNALSLGE